MESSKFAISSAKKWLSWRVRRYLQVSAHQTEACGGDDRKRWKFCWCGRDSNHEICVSTCQPQQFQNVICVGICSFVVGKLNTVNFLYPMSRRNSCLIQWGRRYRIPYLRVLMTVITLPTSENHQHLLPATLMCIANCSHFCFYDTNWYWNKATHLNMRNHQQGVRNYIMLYFVGLCEITEIVQDCCVCYFPV